MSEETSEALNALLHIADDHPCCKLTLLWAHDRLLELERENAALRKDEARLDWLHLTAEGINWQLQNTNMVTRDLIDAARKGVGT